MAEASVELDQHTLLLIGDVMHASRRDHGGTLPTTHGQAVSSLHVTQESHLHRALSAVRDIPEYVCQEATSTVACPFGEQPAQRLVGDQATEEGPPEEGQSVVVRPVIGQVERRLAYRHAPRPVEVVDVPVRIDPAMDHHSARGRHPTSLVDDELDRSWRSAEQPVDEAGGLVRPRRPRHRQLRGESAGMPVVPPGQGLVDARVNANPDVPFEPPPHRLRGHAGFETLPTRQQTSLFRSDGAQIACCARRLGCAENAIVRFATRLPAHTPLSSNRSPGPPRYPQPQARRVVALIRATRLRGQWGIAAAYLRAWTRRASTNAGGSSTWKSRPSMPIHTATTSTLSPPVTRSQWVSSTGSTTPTVGLTRARTSSADASTRTRQWTAQPATATSRSTNEV